MSLLVKCMESVDHVFVQCEVAFCLWKMVFLEGGLSWEIPVGSTALLTARHLGFAKGKKVKVLEDCSVLVVVWVHWMERSRRIYEDYRGAGMGALEQSKVFPQLYGLLLPQKLKDITLYFT